MPTASIAPLGPAELYPRFGRFVHGALCRLGFDAAEADDLAHEVFITLHRKGCRFSHERAARAWLFSTARRLAANARRARRRAASRTAAWVPAQPPAPDAAVQRREAAAVVERFTAGLSEPARTVFELSEVGGLSGPEIADRLGLGLDTTYSHIRRVRLRFARAVALAVACLLILAALLLGRCTAEVPGDGDRVAVRDGADVAARPPARR